MEFIYDGTNQQVPEVVFVFSGDNVFSHLPKRKYNEKQQVTWLYHEQVASQKIIISLGEKSALTMEEIRRAAGNVARSLKEHETTAVQVTLERLYSVLNEPHEVIQAWIEGTMLGGYAFDCFQSEKSKILVEQYYIIGDPIENVEAVIKDTLNKTKSICIARDLANLPANHLTPQIFVKKITSLFETTKVEVNVVEGDEIDKQQLVGLRHVGQGGKHAPAMVELTFRPNKNKPHIALVGKGITFDMGGMSLKNARDLSDARFDMGGAAAVIGTLHYLATTEKDVNVSAFIMIAENVPDANAYLPSTVIEYPNGISVEVANTDAEGRLVLADGLIRSAQVEPDEVINICTLTGSVGIALGMDMAGTWSTGDIAKSLQDIGNENGDFVWEMPLVYDYKRYLKSDYADLHNIGSVHEGGATVAALFLESFAPKSIPWAHIDMAATIQSREERGYLVKGATGYGVRLLSDYILTK